MGVRILIYCCAVITITANPIPQNVLPSCQYQPNPCCPTNLYPQANVQNPPQYAVQDPQILAEQINQVLMNSIMTNPKLKTILNPNSKLNQIQSEKPHVVNNYILVPPDYFNMTKGLLCNNQPNSELQGQARSSPGLSENVRRKGRRRRKNTARLNQSGVRNSTKDAAIIEVNTARPEDTSSDKPSCGCGIVKKLEAEEISNIEKPRAIDPPKTKKQRRRRKKSKTVDDQSESKNNNIDLNVKILENEIAEKPLAASKNAAFSSLATKIESQSSSDNQHIKEDNTLKDTVPKKRRKLAKKPKTEEPSNDPDTPKSSKPFTTTDEIVKNTEHGSNYDNRLARNSPDAVVNPTNSDNPSNKHRNRPDKNTQTISKNFNSGTHNPNLNRNYANSDQIINKKNTNNVEYNRNSNSDVKQNPVPDTNTQISSNKVPNHSAHNSHINHGNSNHMTNKMNKNNFEANRHTNPNNKQQSVPDMNKQRSSSKVSYHGSVANLNTNHANPIQMPNQMKTDNINANRINNNFNNNQGNMNNCNNQNCQQYNEPNNYQNYFNPLQSIPMFTEFYRNMQNMFQNNGNYMNNPYNYDQFYRSPPYNNNNVPNNSNNGPYNNNNGPNNSTQAPNISNNGPYKPNISNNGPHKSQNGPNNNNNNGAFKNNNGPKNINNVPNRNNGPSNGNNNPNNNNNNGRNSISHSPNTVNNASQNNTNGIKNINNGPYSYNGPSYSNDGRNKGPSNGNNGPNSNNGPYNNEHGPNNSNNSNRNNFQHNQNMKPKNGNRNGHRKPNKSVKEINSTNGNVGHKLETENTNHVTTAPNYKKKGENNLTTTEKIEKVTETSTTETKPTKKDELDVNMIESTTTSTSTTEKYKRTPVTTTTTEKPIIKEIEMVIPKNMNVTEEEILVEPAPTPNEGGNDFDNSNATENKDEENGKDAFVLSSLKELGTEDEVPTLFANVLFDDYYPDFTEDTKGYLSNNDDVDRYFYNTGEELNRERRRYEHKDDIPRRFSHSKDYPMKHGKVNKESFIDNSFRSRYGKIMQLNEDSFKTPPVLESPDFMTKMIDKDTLTSKTIRNSADIDDDYLKPLDYDEKPRQEIERIVVTKERPKNVETVYVRSKVIKYGADNNMSDETTTHNSIPDDVIKKVIYRYPKDGSTSVVYATPQGSQVV